MSESNQDPAPEAEGTETAAAEPVKGKKTRVGVVISAKAEKTVTVAVDRRLKHPVYGKYVMRRKKYAAHDEIGCQEGERVLIEETRPLSRTKRWRVVEKIGKGA